MGLPDSLATKQEKLSWQPFSALRSLHSRLSPFESLPLSPFSLCISVSPSYTPRRLSREISDLFLRLRALLFVAFTPSTPVCLLLGAAISFRSFLTFHRCADSVRFFLGGALAWPLARAQTRPRFNPLAHAKSQSVGWPMRSATIFTGYSLLYGSSHHCVKFILCSTVALSYYTVLW